MDTKKKKYVYATSFLNNIMLYYTFVRISYTVSQVGSNVSQMT